MAKPLFKCDKCGGAVSEELLNLDGFAPCNFCGTSLQIKVFPAFFRAPETGSVGERIASEGEASCYFHPEKKAAVPCDACGRFICSLCDIQLGDDHLCASCVESGRQKGKIRTMDNRRTRHDQLALALALYPTVFFFITIFTAPYVLYLWISHRNTPISLVSRSRWRWGLAGALALAQLCLWVPLTIYIIVQQGAR